MEKRKTGFAQKTGGVLVGGGLSGRLTDYETERLNEREIEKLKIKIFSLFAKMEISIILKRCKKCQIQAFEK
jgi:hypothetical protein